MAEINSFVSPETEQVNDNGNNYGKLLGIVGDYYRTPEGQFYRPAIDGTEEYFDSIDEEELDCLSKEELNEPIDFDLEEFFEKWYPTPKDEKNDSGDELDNE